MICYRNIVYVPLVWPLYSIPLTYFEDGGVVPHGFNYIMRNYYACAGVGHMTLLVYVFSAAGERYERNRIRDTWARQLHQDKHGRVIFMLGKINNATLQGELFTEQKTHKDLVQLDFVDHYKNLTIKSVQALRWIMSHCINVDYVMKVDIDVLINTRPLIQFLVSRQLYLKRSVVCWIHRYSLARRWGINGISFRQYPFYLSYLLQRWSLRSFIRCFTSVV